MAVGGGTERSPPLSARRRRRSSADADRTTRGPPHRDSVAGQRHPRRHEGPLAEEHAVPDPGAGHERGGVADLAQVADGGSDHLAAMAEHGAAPDRRRDPDGADDHRVLEDGRSGPDLDAGVLGADHGALGKQRSLTQTGRAHDDCGGGDLRGAGLRLAERAGGSGAHGWAKAGATSSDARSQPASSAAAS